MPYAKRATALFAILLIVLTLTLPSMGFAEEMEIETGLLENLDLQARAAVLLDADTGRVVYGRYAYRRAYPASTTKAMTLLLALEYDNLDEIITVPAEAAQIPVDSSTVPIKPGDKLTFRDLLYGLILHSGNDAANAIAVIVSGSIDAFVDQMNARAAEIGCLDTHFTNPHGYHNAEHYSTAYDMALIAREGMRDPLYRQIVSTLTYTMQKTDTLATLKLKTHNLMLVPSSKYYYEPAIGVKTGTHSKAGQCLIGAAIEKEKLLISTVLYSNSEGRWMDTTTMMQSGYALYDRYTFDDLMARRPITTQVRNAHEEDGDALTLQPATNGTELYAVTCLPDEVDEYADRLAAKTNVLIDGDLRAPIEAGQQVGTLRYTPDDGEPIEIPLVAGRAIREAPKSWWWVVLVAALVVAVLGGGVLYLRSVQQREKKRRRAARKR